MPSELAAKVFGDKENPRLRLKGIFGGSPNLVGPPPVAREWAKKLLDEAGVDPAGHSVLAIRCLRTAQPRLTLKAAAYLANDVSQR